MRKLIIILLVLLSIILVLPILVPKSTATPGKNVLHEVIEFLGDIQDAHFAEHGHFMDDPIVFFSGIPTQTKWYEINLVCADEAGYCLKVIERVDINQNYTLDQWFVTEEGWNERIKKETNF